MGNGLRHFLQPVTVFFGEQGNCLLHRHGSFAGGFGGEENAAGGACHQGDHAHQQNYQQCNAAGRRRSCNQGLEGFHRPADGRFDGGTDFLHALSSLLDHLPGACCRMDSLDCGGPVGLNGGLCGFHSTATLGYPSDGVGRGLGGFLRGMEVRLFGGGFSGRQTALLFADFQWLAGFYTFPALAYSLLCQHLATVQRGGPGPNDRIPGGAFHLFLRLVGCGVWTVLLIGLFRQPAGLFFALQPDLFHGGLGDTGGLRRPGLFGIRFLLDLFRGETSCFLKW